MSVTFTTGVTVLCELDVTASPTGFYTLYNPLKPVAMQDENGSKIALVQMNPFSDSSEFKIHYSHIVSVGSMIADYIEKYVESVHQIDMAIAKRYSDMLIPEHPSKEFFAETTSKVLQ